MVTDPAWFENDELWATTEEILFSPARRGLPGGPAF